MRNKFAAALSSAINKLVKPTRGEVQAGPRAGSDQSHNYMGVQTLDPSRLAAAFSQADTGYIDEQAKLFMLIEAQDPHIYAELAKRRRAITGLPWQLTPPKDATQSELDRVTELTDMIGSIPRFEDALYDTSDAVGKGLAAHEIEWGTGSTWLPKALHYVPQYQLRVDRETGAVQFVNKSGLPEALRPMGWVVHEHRSLSGYIEQAALFRVLAWTYAYKAYNTLDMQKFLEKYGLPLRLGKYPAGLQKSDRDELLRAVRGIGNDGAGVVPSTMSIEFVQATKQGTVTDFLSAIEYWERKQSMAILGGTLTSQADGKTSTNALGAIHNEVRQEILAHDLRQICPTITQQLVHPIALLNGMFAQDRLPTFVFDDGETEDKAELVDVLSKAAGMGMRIDIDYAHKMLRIPKADDKAEVLQAIQQAPAQAAATRVAALSRAADSAGFDVRLQQALDGALDDLLDSEDQGADWLAQLLRDIHSGAQDTQLLETLAERWPAADDAELQERLTRIIFVAEVLGRLERQLEQSGQGAA